MSQRGADSSSSGAASGAGTSEATPRDGYAGRTLGNKYQLTRLLGRGGMGAVYEGRTPIGKRVAVKLLLNPELARNLDLIARFFREAHAAAAVESKHVVDVYDTGVDEETGVPFIIMAHLGGEDLDEVVRRVGPLNPLAAVRIASQAAAGLARAHDAGIIHRDVKPANLFLAADEGELVVKILDFGIAKLGPQGELARGGPLTQSGTLLGTPLYMSPEQAQGLKNIDARTDIWSLGMCLYQALAGRPPFGEIDTVGKLIVAIVTHDVPPLASLAPWVRPELAAVVHRALARDVDDRFASMRDLIAGLSPFVNGSVTLTPNLVVAAREALDVTLAPGVTRPPPPEAATLAATPVPTPAPSAATTDGVSSGRDRPRSVTTARPARVPVPMAAAALVAVALGVFALTRGSSRSEPGTEAPTGPSPERATASAPPPPSSELSPPAASPDETKVGVMTLRIPTGYTVMVDGFAPGSPESHGAARFLPNGKLELRGEFLSKYLVAIFDASGKRVMVQDVYLYDGKLDPETIDTTIGVVAVAKPKRRANPTSAATDSARAPAPSASELPARF